MAEVLELKAARGARGSVRLPGSKSISNRVLLAAALAAGESAVRGLLDAEDTRVMREALERLGVPITERAQALSVHGAGGVFREKKADLFLGNAGTALRPLTAALAFSEGEYFVSGVPRMHERPIGDLVDALRSIGARIDYRGKPGFPPLAIHPAKLRLDAAVPVKGDVSSQFLSALLMALPLAGGDATIEVRGELISKPYVEITLNVMRRFGVAVERDGWSRFRIPRARFSSPGTLYVEGDASSASYFLAAGALGGGPVRVEGVGRESIQGDVRFADVLEAMGANVRMGDGWIECAGRGRLHPIDMDLNHIPDAAMTAAVLALFADGPSRLRNIASWRVKETDRIAAMAAELRKLGAQVEDGSDYLRIVPGELKPGVAIDTYDDHRMAMSCALVALGGLPVRIKNPECVAKTFPDYFAALASITA
ncbi:MAG: 3-phosphoshikimate 1-carboxyvinyltransferase [Betaproteobacteria bacterium]|nr:MAG: 3-phosphoshikimate 1-carboxyvinyltransferase [Betaproteobacteria bacterium]